MTSLAGHLAARPADRRPGPRAARWSWIAGIVLLVLVTAVSTKGIYPRRPTSTRPPSRPRDNPAALAFNGPDQAPRHDRRARSPSRSAPSAS